MFPITAVPWYEVKAAHTGVSRNGQDQCFTVGQKETEIADVSFSNAFRVHIMNDSVTVYSHCTNLKLLYIGFFLGIVTWRNGLRKFNIIHM